MAVRVRLYPTAAQSALLARMSGCKRFVCNAMLQEWKAYYECIGGGRLISACEPRPATR
jgi:transposase